jgi:hypothetical protein
MDRTSLERQSGAGDTPDSESADAGDELPVWLKWSILVCILLSVVFLAVAYVYPYVRSPVEPVEQGPAWKQTANSIIDTALDGETRNIPELIGYLDSGEPPVRRNAEWALYYMTGLPWASKPEVCRTWWKAHGKAVMDGEKPSEPRPEPEEFARERRPEEVNVDRYFQLLSPRRLMITGPNTSLTYERGLVNKNQDRSLRIYPPDVLPYRAYKYGKEIPASVRQKNNISRKRAKIPVHLQYGPSVSMVYVEWFRASSPDQALRKEFLEFSVLGRNQDTLAPGKSMGVRKPFPVHPPADLFDHGPHALVRLTLDGRDLLAKRTDEKVRIRFDDMSHTVHLFRPNPVHVPGYTDRELAKLKRKAEKHGYRLKRAERVRAGAFTASTGIRPEETTASAGQGTGSAWTTGSGTPQKPRTMAASPSDFETNRLIYDQTFSWGQVEVECCKRARKDDHRLSDIHGYAGSHASRKKAQSVMNRYAGRRWILVFEEAPEEASESSSSE